MESHSIDLIVDASNIKYHLINKLSSRFPKYGLRGIANLYFSNWRAISDDVSALRYARQHPESETAFGDYLWGKSYVVYRMTLKQINNVERRVRAIRNG